MKTPNVRSRTAITLVVLAAFAIALSSCSRGFGCPGLITKVQPAHQEVRS